MTLNLINDAWIPVLRADGSRSIIAPWQMAEPGIVRPDWPRPDFNIACYEFLIGLVFLADPPCDIEDWDDRSAPDPARLKEKLAPFAPAFDLLGDGPRFLQDHDKLMDAIPKPIEQIVLDSGGAGGNFIAKTGRYEFLTTAEAAIALYTLQSQAPEGGRGYRTSLRGGGPLVTLVDPRRTLWDFVWANVPYGMPGTMGVLPWMRNETQGTTNPSYPNADVLAEVFFSMPRRVILEAGTHVGKVSSFREKNHGKQYALWKHPCTPYYRKEVTEPWSPVRGARMVGMSYRNWLGVTVSFMDTGHAEKALVLQNWWQRGGNATVIVAGWAMKSAKARDFIWSVQPLLHLNQEAEFRLIGLVRAAETTAAALWSALVPVLAKGEAREAEREAFFIATETAFHARVAALVAGEDVATLWLEDLRAQALAQFEALALPQLSLRDTKKIEQIVQARKFLALAFKGYGKQGRELFNQLELEVPVVKKGKAV